ncbi:MAG: hypothetical protein Kow002_19800 [Anaerolineales bacterium]
MPATVTRVLNLVVYTLLAVLLLSASAPLAGDRVEQARAYTRALEFDYTRWSINAAWLKLQTGTAGLPHYLHRAARKQIVMDYLFITERLIRAENHLEQIYADPSISNKEANSAHLRAEIDTLQKRQKHLAPLAESVMQAQISALLHEQQLTSGGQPIPPVLYHASPVPMGLIISPRERIEQLSNISLQPNLSVDQRASLEEQVDKTLNVSSLVVPIGGVGVYPTMVMRTTNLPWLLNVIAHEWTHNYLSLRPLGVLYSTDPQIRTMNETAASIVGNEIGELALQRYYPELTATSSSTIQPASAKPAAPPFNEEPPFDFRAEMRETRVRVDELLAEGKIEEAEAYMESRRQIFWENGYAIRKLNQAYFAFYGAYADVPGGPAGEDPVGPAVRALREQSESLAEFLNTISWMTSFAELEEALAH